MQCGPGRWILDSARHKVRGGWPPWSESPLPTLAVFLVVGVVVGRHLPEPELAWLGSVALALVAALAGPRTGAAVAVALSAWLLGLALGHPTVLSYSLADHAVVQGVVTQSSSTSAVVRTDRGQVRASFFPEPAPPVGTRLSARTRPVRPKPRLPGEPDRRAADVRAGRPVRRVTRWVRLGPEAESVPARDVPDVRHAGVLLALATGRRAALDPSMRRLLQRTGTAHLLAISGLHIGLVAGLIHGLMGWLGSHLLAWMWLARGARVLRWARALAAVGGAAAYAHSVGWPVSTQRAVVMVAGAALAHAVGRRVRPWSLLSLAAFVVVVVEPSAVDGLGFGLSFGAVLGILAVGPRLSRWIPPDTPWLLQRIAVALAVTLAAMAGTLPLTAWWFQELSPLSPLANLLVGPLIGAIAVPAALLGTYGPALIQQPAYALGSLAVEVAVTLLSWLDVAPWTPAVGPIGALLIVAGLLLRRHPLLALPLVIGVLVVRTIEVRSDLEVTFLGVGQGDAVFIRHPDGRRWLFDGGPPSDGVLRWLRREGHTRLDTVLLSHPDSDHLGGLQPVLDGLEVGRVVVGRPPVADEESYRAAWNTMFSRGIPVSVAADGPVAGVELLHPSPGWRAAAGPHALRRPKDNDDSLVVLLEHEGQRVLLTGDIERAAEDWLASRLPEVDVVQAPHHGSRTSSSAGLVAATNPDWVVISCGLGNRFGHPHANTLASWRGRRILRTDLDGSIRLRVRAAGIVVERWVAGWGWSGLGRAPWRPLLPRGGSPKFRRP